MPSSKRQYAALDRELIRALTHACETAKGELPGFVWLTHQVDYTRLPDSLVVTWVFDTKANRLAANTTRMQALTLAAFDAVGIRVQRIARHVETAVEAG